MSGRYLAHATDDRLQERRFYIMEGAGCTPATYWNAWGVLAMAFVPIAIAVGAMVYTGPSALIRRDCSTLTSDNLPASQ